MRKLPTDLEIFNEIYERYYDTFAGFSRSSPNRQVKNYVPIDIKEIAQVIGVDGDIIFGRLYYIHQRKLGYEEEDETGRKTIVPFFDIDVGKERHAIHFPMMAAVLSELRKEEKMYKYTIRIAAGALVASIFSVIISVAG